MDDKKCCGNCFSFIKKLKAEVKSNRGNTLEKFEHKNHCGRFHTTVNPNTGICWHWVTLDEIIEEGLDDE